jgi:hypothetical protein
MIAYRESQGLIYIGDHQADAALSSLKEAGIPAEVVKSDKSEISRSRQEDRPHVQFARRNGQSGLIV